MQLAGARVLVTGASRGIGAAIAARFAEGGARVALVARSAEPLQALATALGGTAHVADLADHQQLAGLVSRVEADGGPVDVLVNNAGVGLAAHLAGCDAETVERTYRLNLLAPAELCRQAVPGMLRRGRGHLVNVSSFAGVAAFPGLCVYGSSKAGLSHLTAGLRADLRGTAVRTTLVEVGPVPSDLLDGLNAYGPTDGSFRRMHRLRLLADVTAADVATAVVRAVRRDRRHVRLPRRGAVAPLLAEVPRRVVELVLTGVPPRRGA
jgi:short-subunit dehydrogenase